LDLLDSKAVLALEAVPVKDIEVVKVSKVAGEM
jgi:hypothetical protein